jgi:hypothetical protein
VTQKGYDNALSAVSWIQQQQSSGALASTLSDFVVMGCSAGSIGAQIWSDNALNFVNWKKVSQSRDCFHPRPFYTFTFKRLLWSQTAMLESSLKALKDL